MVRLCDEIRGDDVHGDVYRNAGVFCPPSRECTTEKNRFDGGDGVEEASNAVAAVEARATRGRGKFHGPIS